MPHFAGLNSVIKRLTIFATARFSNAPILAYPDYTKPFVLDTDASNSGIGAFLSQVQENGTECVVAYASRSLTRQEQKYCVTRRELLACSRGVYPPFSTIFIWVTIYTEN